MKSTRHRGPLPRALAKLLPVLSLLIAPTLPAQQDKPVSWVNAKLPAGPGLTHHVLDSKSLGHDVGYVVWTPQEYDPTGETKYPVIYFLHGMGGTESADAGGFSGLLARGIKDGHLPAALCIFPNGGRSGYRGEVEAMILTELIPHIDKSYPTVADPKARLLAGFSMGGAGAVRLAIMHPDTFGAAGSWGGGMRRGEDALVAAVDQAAAAMKKNNFAALLVNGDQDRPDAYQSLAAKFATLAIPHEVVVLPDTPHNLGLYYERAGEKMTRFLGKQLQ